jgi:hypothetical protein
MSETSRIVAIGNLTLANTCNITNIRLSSVSDLNGARISSSLFLDAGGGISGTNLPVWLPNSTLIYNSKTIQTRASEWMSSRY